MPNRLTFKELATQEVEHQLQADLLAASTQIGEQLKPRRPILNVDGKRVTFVNMAGSMRLRTGEIVEVSPKVDGDPDWTQAVVHLLEPNTRIAVTGSRRSQPPTDLTTCRPHSPLNTLAGWKPLSAGKDHCTSTRGGNWSPAI